MSGKWADVVLEKMVVVSGGYSDKPCVVTSKELYLERRRVEFVKVNKNDHWMLKGAGGKGCQKGGLRRTGVVEALRDKLRACTGGDACTESTPEAADAAVAADDDPMANLDDIAGGSVTQASKMRRTTKRQAARPRETAKRVEMPERLGRPQLRTVTAIEASKCVLWILEDDVPWLLRYLADEVDSGGVPPIDDPDGEEGEPEGSAVADSPGAGSAGDEHVVTPEKTKPERNAGVQIRWDFTGAWVATVKSGPKKGSTVACKVASMSAEKWAAAAAEHQCTTTFADATPRMLREAARHYL